MSDPRNQKIAIATAATMVVIVLVWIATLPGTLKSEKKNISPMEVSTNAAWAELQAKLQEVRTQLQNLPSTSGSVNAALPPSLVQSLQIKIQGTASGTKLK